MADSPEELRRKALETASVVEDALRSIADNIATAFESAITGADRVSQAVAKDIQSRFNKMAKVTDDLAGNAVKLKQGLLDVRDVNKQILDRQIKQESLGTQLVTLLKQQGIAASNVDDLIQGHLSGTIRLIDEQKTLVEEYIKAKGFNDDYIEQLEEQKAAQDEINAKLGNTGKLVKGISKIPILGNLVDTDETLKIMNQNIVEGGNRISAMKAGFKNLGSQIKTSLTDPLTVTTFFITQFVSALKSADTATGDLAKDFNLTYNEAANVRNELIEIGNLSGNIALNARALQESMVAVGQSLGSNAMLNQADLETFTELREMAGYTNEELIGIQKLTLATGGNLKDNTKQFLGTVAALNAQNKLTVNEKQLLKEVSNTSAAIKLSIGGTTKGLAEAAFQAKQFGINLEQADKIAESLLDFESSITAELEAELITGKDLNLERARLLALNGDIAGASAEILKQVKGSAEFTKMNRIQQESLAKAVGMSREELAASLVEREALNKIGVKDAAAAKAEFDTLVKKYGYDKAVAMLGDEEYARQLKQQDIQERFNKSVEKLKEIFISIAEPVLQIVSPLMDIVVAIASLAPSISPFIKYLITGYGVLKGIQLTLGAIAGIQTFITASKATELGLGGSILANLGFQNAAEMYKLTLMTGGNTLAAIRAGLEQTILGSIIAQGFGIIKNIGQLVVQLGVQMGLMSASLATNAALTFGVGVAVAVAAALAGYAALKSITSVGDMYSPANGKTQVSTKEGGLFELSKNDSLFAFPESKIKSNSGRSTSTSTNTITQQPIDYDKLASAIGKEVSNKPVIVENSMDGSKFGTAVAMNTYKIQ